MPRRGSYFLSSFFLHGPKSICMCKRIKNVFFLQKLLKYKGWQLLMKGTNEWRIYLLFAEVYRYRRRLLYSRSCIWGCMARTANCRPICEIGWFGLRAHLQPARVWARKVRVHICKGDFSRTCKNWCGSGNSDVGALSGFLCRILFWSVPWVALHLLYQSSHIHFLPVILLQDPMGLSGWKVTVRTRHKDYCPLPLAVFHLSIFGTLALRFLSFQYYYACPSLPYQLIKLGSHLRHESRLYKKCLRTRWALPIGTCSQLLKEKMK